MTRRLWPAVVVATAGAGLLVSAGVAGGQRTSETSERRGGTYRLTLSADFDYIDPALAYFFHSGTMQAATQLRLLFFPPVEGPESKRLRPMAAEDLPRVSADGLTYTFALRRGFRFSNGEPVTARSLVRAFQRVLSPKLQSPGSSFLDDVRRYWAPSRYVLKVRLERVAPDFLARMTMNDPVFNRRMDEAYRASGEERLRLYGLLDRDIVRDAAPIVPFRNGNARIFVGPYVGCFSFSSLHGTNLVAVCKTR